jgi:hypothetical protein
LVAVAEEDFFEDVGAGNRESRFLAGMTERKAKARATASANTVVLHCVQDDESCGDASGIQRSFPFGFAQGQDEGV